MKTNDLVELRGNRDALLAFVQRGVREIDGRHIGIMRLLPMRVWFGRRYLVEGKINLTPDAQSLDVFDITDLNAALFPDPNRPYDENSQMGIIEYPDEGSLAVLLEDGADQWIRPAYLPVRVQPGTTEDYRTTDLRIMDELEASVEAGGSILR